jgi:hypothetical protein
MTQNETVPRPPLPVAEPPMDRAALLLAVSRVASAAALGRTDDEQRRLDGRRFEVRIRFGCPGSGAEIAAAPFGLTFDEEDRTLRVRAAPDLSLDDPPVRALAGDDVEAVEGFWMRRPWLLADGCPAAPPAQDDAATEKGAEAPVELEEVKASVPASRQRVGIAQFFTDEDSRTRRRNNRAYEATKVLGEGEAPSAQGYNLVLSGRLRHLPQRPVISCSVTSRDAPPECIVTGEFDRVWIEDPVSRAIVAEWGS